MNNRDGSKNFTSGRPLVLISNSSWYINHYRKSLIKTLTRDGQNVIALSPIDSSSSQLSSNLLHIPLDISRSRNFNLFYLFLSLIKLLVLVRCIKPKLIHSHTIKANLLTSIVSSFYGIPCVLSFAGMGKLSKSKGLGRLLILSVLYIIRIFSNYQNFLSFSIKSNSKRCAFIFQNPRDLKTFGNFFVYKNNSQSKLVLGSGVPPKYFNTKLNTLWHNYSFNNVEHKSNFTFIFCARLLRSKGVITFKKLSEKLSIHEFIAFGGIDPSNNDSLSELDISDLTRNSNNLRFIGHKINPLLDLDYPLPVLVIPSNYGEGLPRTIAECLALKIPVICSKNASCDVFTDDYVYISNGNNVQDYIECFFRLKNDCKTGKIVNKLDNGYSFANDFLLEDRIIERTVNIYSELEDNFLFDKSLFKGYSNFDNWLSQ